MSNSFFALQLVVTYTPFSILSLPFPEYISFLQSDHVQASGYLSWHLWLLVSWILGLP